ncbi:MAG: hypothetical protein NVSMB29_16280 [Candidatus Dormibacteria bacterium]
MQAAPTLDRSTRVLLVDDDPRLSRVVATYLKLEGYDVSVATGAIEGMQLLADEPYDIAFLDVMMPGMDGIEACRRLRSNPATAQIPVVIFTALSSERDCERARLAGASHLITKPFGLLGLGNIVESLTHRRRGALLGASGLAPEL